MYFLIGILATLSIFMHFVQSDSQAAEPVYQEYRQAMEDNDAHFDNLKERYRAFDVLKETKTVGHMPRDYRGYWQPANKTSTLYYISDDNKLTEYGRNRGTSCYRSKASRDLLFYGDNHVIEKSRGREDRFYYTLEEYNVLNIELIYINSTMGSTEFHKIRAGDVGDIEFCKSRKRKEAN